MNDINRRLNKLKQRRMMTRYKHLRGRHNQLEHAWNRGLGAATAAVGAARTRAQSLMNSIRGAAGGALASMSARAQSLIGQAQGIADAIQSKTGGLIGRVNALLQRTRGGSRGSESQVQGDTGANQSALERVIGRINALRNRRGSRGQQETPSPIVETTPQPSEPKLPDGYDTTRFDTPSKNAPMPIKREILQPGGEVYDSVKSLYESGDFINVDDRNSDMLLIAVRGMGEYFPSSRWHVGFFDTLNMSIIELQNVLQSLGVNTGTLPSSQSQMYTEFNSKRRKTQNAEDGVSDDNPYVVAAVEMAKSYHDEYSPRPLEEEIAAAKARAKNVVYAYELSKQLDYNELNDLASEEYRYAQNLVTQARNELELMKQEYANNSDNEILKKQIDTIESRIAMLESHILTESPRFTKSGEVAPLGISQLISSLPATKVSSLLYGVYGYDAKPEVAAWNELSNKDAYSLNGLPLMLYRSIRGSSDIGFVSATSSVGNLTANQIYESTINSETAHVGLGVDGMGMYWKSRGDNSEQSLEEGDGISLKYGREKYGNNTFASIIKQGTRLYDKPVANLYDGVTYGSTMARELREEFISRFGDIFGESLPDVGAIMTMLGWEGYMSRSDEKGGFNWVMLNRAAMIISQEMITPDTPQDIIDKAFRTGRI